MGQNIKRIGIITSGGDCGGLNAVIKGVGLMGLSLGIETVIIPNGYAGLYNLAEMESVVTLTPLRLSFIKPSLAGSEAGHSRVKVKKIEDPDKYERIKSGLGKFGIDALIISGGDDTGSVIVDLTGQGISCVHVPKTMDLDLQTYSVGGDSAVNRIAGFMRDLHTTGMSHNRVIVMEVFGRYAGHTAFRGGIAGEADCILIPEVPVDFDVVYKHMKKNYAERVLQSDVKAGTYGIVVAEGITDAAGQVLSDKSAGVDAFGHAKLAGAGKYVRKKLEEKMKNDPAITAFMKKSFMFTPGVYMLPEIREVTPGHLVRSGGSFAFDVNFGMRVGAAAVQLVKDGITGVTVVEVKGNRIEYIPTAEAIKQRKVDLEELSLYESMGLCFGREPVPFKPETVKMQLPIDRNL